MKKLHAVSVPAELLRELQVRYGRYAMALAIKNGLQLAARGEAVYPAPRVLKSHRETRQVALDNEDPLVAEAMHRTRHTSFSNFITTLLWTAYVKGTADVETNEEGTLEGEALVAQVATQTGQSPDEVRNAIRKRSAEMAEKVNLDDDDGDE